LDFDISYPDGGKTIIVRPCAASSNMYYSHDYGANFFPASITSSGPLGGQNKMNVATTSALDVLHVENITPYYTVDGGVSWTIGSALYGGGVGFCAGQNILAVGRWPYNVNKVYWLACPGGVNPVPDLIAYSVDKMVTIQNKTGDWQSVIGALTAPVTIVPLWLGY
jgi:hypothetical protein